MHKLPISTNSVWGFSSPGRIVYGRGASDSFADFAKQQRWQRGLLVTDHTIRRLGHPAQIQASLAELGVQVEIYDTVEPEPAIETVECAVNQWRGRADGAMAPDFVIGLGGGSCLDVAKMAAVLLTYGGNCRDYFGFDRIPGALCTLVAIPSTAGTGSEVSHSAVLTDRQAGIKVSSLSRFLRPQLAIIDPRLTDTCPPRVTADSGIDALVHAIEAYSARDHSQMLGVSAEARAYEGAHPLGKLLALEAIRLIDQNLDTAVHHGEVHAARDAMALAAMYAGMAFSNCGVALVHGLEYPLGALVHCSHGAGNGLLLPYVMRFNSIVASNAFAEIADAIGAKNGDVADRANWLIERVIDLRQRIGIPNCLRDLGTPLAALPELAEKTSKIERLMTLNPRRATISDLVQILHDAY